MQFTWLQLLNRFLRLLHLSLNKNNCIKPKPWTFDQCSICYKLILWFFVHLLVLTLYSIASPLFPSKFTYYFTLYYFDEDFWITFVPFLITIFLFSYLSIRDVLLVIFVILTLCSQQVTQYASADSTWQRVYSCLCHTREAIHDPLYLNFYKTIHPSVKKNSLSFYHPTAVIDPSEYIPVKGANTLLMSWTNNLNSSNVRDYIKLHNAFPSPYCELLYYPDFHVKSSLNYDPFCAVENFWNPPKNTGKKFKNPGVIFSAIDSIDLAVAEVNKINEATLFPSEILFHHSKFRLWDVTDDFIKLESLILNNPNSFTHLGFSPSAFQEVLNCNDSTFDNYLDLVKQDRLGLEEFTKVVLADVHDKTTHLDI